MATKIKCVVTGLTKGVRPAIFNKRVEKAGSEDELLRTYVSNEGKRQLREGLSVDEIRTQAGTSGDDTLQSASDLETVINDITSKKASKSKAKAKAPKAKASAPAEPEVEESITDDIDPDVAAFLGTDESADAKADISPAV
jgi:hypothetical protein